MQENDNEKIQSEGTTACSLGVQSEETTPPLCFAMDP